MVKKTRTRPGNEHTIVQTKNKESGINQGLGTINSPRLLSQPNLSPHIQNRSSQ